MERRLESVKIKYYQKYVDKEDLVELTSVVLTYRNIINGVSQSIDTITLGKGYDYSEYDEKIQKICQIAFEE